MHAMVRSRHHAVVRRVHRCRRGIRGCVLRVAEVGSGFGLAGVGGRDVGVGGDVGVGVDVGGDARLGLVGTWVGAEVGGKIGVYAWVWRVVGWISRIRLTGTLICIRYVGWRLGRGVSDRVGGVRGIE